MMKTVSKRLLAVLSVLTMLMTTIGVFPVMAEDTTEQQLADMAKIKERFAEYYANNYVAEYGVEESKAAEYLQSQKEDGSWEDIDYYDTTNTANGLLWQPKVALRRMQVLATNYYKTSNPTMLEGVQKALEHWRSIRDANPEQEDYEGPWCTNWWENGHGVGGSFYKIGVMLEDELSEEDMAMICRKLDVFGATDPGQNALWQTQKALFRALFENNPTQFKKIVDECLCNNLGRSDDLGGEAVMVDNSFHAHGNLLYSNGYGKSLVQDMSLWMYYLGDTCFALPQKSLDLMADYVLDGTRWMIRSDLLELGTLYSSLPNAGGYEENWALEQYGVAIQRLIAADPAHADEYQKLLDNMQGNRPEGSGVDGNKDFWTSDYMSHVRDGLDGYSVNVRTDDFSMKSGEWRTEWPADADPEKTGNLVFWTTAGMTSLMIDGDEYSSVLRTFDWRHTPGTTTPFILSNRYNDGDNGNDDSISVSNGRQGAISYTYEKTDRRKNNSDPHSGFSTGGKLSYFFFDDEYVALGADIHSNNTLDPIHSTVNQTKAAEVSVNGKALGTTTLAGETFDADYVYNNKVGYIFPETTTVQVSNLHQAGQTVTTWSEEEQQKSTDTFDLWIDHGIAPKDGSYAYIVLPNATEAEVAAYSQDNQITIVANTKTVQAVRHEGLKQTQVAFYEAGTLEYAPGKTVSVDGACALIIDESGEVPLITEAVSNTQPGAKRSVALTMDDVTTYSCFMSSNTPYAGQSITLEAGGNSLIQSGLSEVGYSVGNAFDSELATSWKASSVEDSWIRYDLEQSLYVGDITVRWGDVYATKYDLYTSTNGADWELAYSCEDGQGGIETIPHNTIGRYWKLVSNETSTGEGVEIQDVYFVTSSNLALGRPVTSSGEDSTLATKYAVDGDLDTRWGGVRNRDDNWIIVDLGSSVRLDAVQVDWEYSCASEYTIDVSDDGDHWRTIYTETSTERESVQTAMPLGTTGRYVRIQGVKAAHKQYGMSLWELSVYGGVEVKTDAATSGKTTSDTTTKTVDLVDAYWVHTLDLTWSDQPANAYTVEISSDGQFWQTAADNQQNTETSVRELIAVNGRYLKVTVASGETLPELTVNAVLVSEMHPDLTELRQEIEVIIPDSLYTEDSVEAYRLALSQAEQVLALPYATQSMVNAILEDLKTARANLTLRDLGTVMATLTYSNSTVSGRKQVLGTSWASFDTSVDLSERDLSKIYLFFTVTIECEDERSGMFSSGRVLLKSGNGGENYCLVPSLDFHVGENILYIPLSDINKVQAGTMDWSDLRQFRMYVDSLNNYDVDISFTFSDIQILDSENRIPDSPEKAELKQLLQAQKSDLTLYTIESVTEYNALFDEGWTVYRNAQATDEEVTTILAAIKAADDLLVVDEDAKTLLGTLQADSVQSSEAHYMKVEIKADQPIDISGYEEGQVYVQFDFRVDTSHTDPAPSNDEWLKQVKNGKVEMGETASATRTAVVSPFHSNNAVTKSGSWTTLRYTIPADLLEKGSVQSFFICLYNDTGALGTDADGVTWDNGSGVAFSVRNVKILADNEADVVTPVDKTALNTAIAAAEAKLVDGKTYTADTLAALNTALTEAENLATDADQTAVDNATEKLNTAIAGLQEEPIVTVTLGDVNGDGEVTAEDALMALQAATDKITLTETQEQAADVAGNDGVTAADALLILQYATKKIALF